MIIVITKQIKFFILILATFTLSMSFCLKALHQNDDYDLYWMKSFRLMMTDFEDEYSGFSEKILFTMGCFLLSIISLNLLIAIMGDAFDDVQSKAEIADVREKLELIKEVGKFIFWDNDVDLRYIHWVSTPFLREKKETTWVGKIMELKNFIGTGLKSIILSLSSQIASMSDMLKTHIEI